VAKSIIDVEVNDEDFKAFAALYEKFRAAAEKAPKGWGGGSPEDRKKRDNEDSTRRTRDERSDKDRERSEKRARTTWADVATKSKLVFDNVKGITASLLRWASIGTVFTGLLGGGGLFGLDRLAGSVGANRRASMGLGVSYGEKKAFDVNYGRVVDSEGFLSSINAATHDASLRAKLYGAGIGENQLRGSTADVSLRLLQQIKRIADQTPAALLQQTMSARGLDQFISLQEFERIKATSRGELAGYADAFGRDKREFGLDATAQLAWQNFAVRMTRAGQKIENVFVVGLGRAHIPEALDKLSDAFAKSVETFMSSPDLEKWLKSVGDGIQGFAGYVGSGKFQTDIKEFTANIGLAAQGVVKALQWLRLIPTKVDVPNMAPSGGAAARKRQDDFRAGILQGNSPEAKKWLLQNSRRISVDELLPSIAKVESANGKFNLSPKGARGMYQIMPATAAAYGKNPDDPKQAREMAKAELLRMIRHYSGDLEKILSGYNWGQGNTDKAIAKYGANWKAHAPAETKAYIIKIENNTGGNAVVTASQLPQ